MGYKKPKKLISRSKKLIKVMFDIEKKDSFCKIFLFLWDSKEMFLKFEEKNSRFQKHVLKNLTFGKRSKFLSKSFR